MWRGSERFSSNIDRGALICGWSGWVQANGCLWQHVAVCAAWHRLLKGYTPSKAMAPHQGIAIDVNSEEIICVTISQTNWSSDWLINWLTAKMNEWMNEWMNELMNKWMNEWMNEVVIQFQRRSYASFARPCNGKRSGPSGLLFPESRTWDELDRPQFTTSSPAPLAKERLC